MLIASLCLLMTQCFPLEAVNQSVMDVCFQPELEKLKRKTTTTTKACTKTIKYKINEAEGYIIRFHVLLLFCPLPLSWPSALRRAAVATKVKVQPLWAPSGFPSPAFSVRSDPRRHVSQMGRGPILMDEWRQKTRTSAAVVPDGDGHALSELPHAAVKSRHGFSVFLF